jgi:starch synthase
MTTPENTNQQPPKPPAPPPAKPASSDFSLAALWPKETEVRGQRPEVSQPKPEVSQPKPVVAPPPAPAKPATPVPKKKIETAVPDAKPVVSPPPVATPAPVIQPAPVPAVRKVEPEIPVRELSLPPAVVAAPPPKSGALEAKPVVAVQPPAVPKPEPKLAPVVAPTPKLEAAAPKPVAVVPSLVPTPAKKTEKPRPSRKPARPEVSGQKSEVSGQRAESREQKTEAAEVPVAPLNSQPSAISAADPAPPPARPSRPSLFIAMVASECAPVAKVGGLGDVVYGLARELEIRGNSVEVFLPKYDCLRYDQIYGLQLTFKDLWVPWNGGTIHCSVYFGFVHGRKCFFIEPHSEQNFFNRRCFYGQNDDDLRFAFFCRAALEFMLKSGKQPDVIHCHDWQTALVPVLLYEMYKFIGMGHPRACFTLHNLQHQGITGAHVLRATGLNRPEYFFHPDRLQDNFNRGALNLMKGGIVYSNFITTVSPHYAWEIMNTNQDYGLGPTLHTHRCKIGGILNGLDYDTWNPEVDRHIPQMYGVATLEKKYENKKALRQRFWLQDVFKPVVTYIGRLDHQKGVPLITHAINYCLQHGAQFVLLGTSPDAKISQHFWGLKRQFNDNPDCHIEISFNEELSHLIYAGADMIVVPSLFEPCGLTQLIGLKYGTVPVVRAVGGLADTVFDANYATKPYQERNGYVFNDFNAVGIESALSRAIGLWYNYPQHFRELMVNAMNCDYSWNHSGEHYLNIYDLIRDK